MNDERTLKGAVLEAKVGASPVIAGAFNILQHILLASSKELQRRVEMV